MGPTQGPPRLHGRRGSGIATHGGSSCDKADSYRAHLQGVLKTYYVSLREIHRLRGRLLHASFAMSSMRGFMMPLNAELGQGSQTIGLAKTSEVREVLSQFDLMLEASCQEPTHITELMGPHLPHFYGYCDASAEGAGGVWLPCTRHCPAIVWRLKWPPWVEREVRKQKGGRITNSDVECAAVFLMECLVEQYLTVQSAGLATWVGSDNNPSVSWMTRMASRLASRIPDRFLRLLAMRQRLTRRGPLDTHHVQGILNGMANFSSRSFVSHPEDEAFIAHFSNTFRLPAQLGSWTHVPVPIGIISVTLSILQMDPILLPQIPATGVPGLDYPALLDDTLASTGSKALSTTWNEQTCSWPLLLPCGEESLTVADKLATRRS
jgi:hypothetical protein